jgi:hypothetical protein
MIARLTSLGIAALFALSLAPMSTASAAQGSDTVVKSQQGEMIQMAGGHTGGEPKKEKKKKKKKKKEG